MNHAQLGRSRRPWLRTLAGSCAVILCVLGLIAGIAYAKVRQVRAANSQPPQPEMPITVTFAKARAVTFRRSSVVVGNVLAPESIALQTELTGTVTQVPMIPGGVVQKGDLLIQLDDRMEQAQLKSAEATRKLAETSLARSRRLSQANANSESDVDIAEAELTRAEAEVEQLRVRIDRMQLRSPFRARVGLFDLHVGQYLESGSMITTLEGIADYFNVDFAMPAHVADGIRIGDDVELRIDESSEPLTAKIVALDSAANANSRSLTARARLQNPPALLQPNDSVRVMVFYGDPIPARLVPATSVRRGPSGTIVFVAEDVEGVLRARSRDVMVAGSVGNLARVVGGVDEGERVVADGSFKVNEGAMLAAARADDREAVGAQITDAKMTDTGRLGSAR